MSSLGVTVTLLAVIWPLEYELTKDFIIAGPATILAPQLREIKQIKYKTNFRTTTTAILFLLWYLILKSNQLVPLAKKVLAPSLIHIPQI